MMADSVDESPKNVFLPRTALAILWIAWTVLLPGTFLVLVSMCWYALRWWWFTSSLVLSLTAWLVWAWLKGHAAVGAASGQNRKAAELTVFAGLIALGMTLGAFADIYGIVPRLARPIPGVQNLTVSLIFFGLGHIAYIAGCIVVGRRLGILVRERRFGGPLLAASLMFWLSNGLALWYALASATPVAWGCLAYTLLLSTTTATMTAMAVLDRRFVFMAVGAVLFLVSDCFLAVKLFHGNAYNLGEACWIAYGIGQMLIVFGAAHVIEHVLREEE